MSRLVRICKQDVQSSRESHEYKAVEIPSDQEILAAWNRIRRAPKKRAEKMAKLRKRWAVIHRKHRKEKEKDADMAKRRNRFVMAASMRSDDFYKTLEWKEFRIQVLQEYESRCFACGRTPFDGVSIQVDHIKPRWIYPEFAFSMWNMQILCADCNQGKGTKLIPQFKVIRRPKVGA